MLTPPRAPIFTSSKASNRALAIWTVYWPRVIRCLLQTWSPAGTLATEREQESSIRSSRWQTRHLQLWHCGLFRLISRSPGSAASCRRPRIWRVHGTMSWTLSALTRSNWPRPSSSIAHDTEGTARWRRGGWIEADWLSYRAAIIVAEKECCSNPQGLPGTAVRGPACTVVWELGGAIPPATRFGLFTYRLSTPREKR